MFSRPAGAYQHDHALLFYESDEMLCDKVAEFLATGLRRQQSALVIATAPHRRGIVRHLEIRGIDMASVADLGLVVMRDAGRMLQQIMRNGEPDANMFVQNIGPFIEKLTAAQTGNPIVVYGEVVDLLWRSGQAQQAAAVEALWNKLIMRPGIRMLCGYSMDPFFRQAVHLPALVAEHSRIRFVDRTTANLPR